MSLVCNLNSQFVYNKWKVTGELHIILNNFNHKESNLQIRGAVEIPDLSKINEMSANSSGEKKKKRKKDEWRILTAMTVRLKFRMVTITVNHLIVTSLGNTRHLNLAWYSKWCTCFPIPSIPTGGEHQGACSGWLILSG